MSVWRKRRDALVSAHEATESGAIDTSEGRMNYSPGDMIVTDPFDGRQWPCSKEYFRRVYEPAPAQLFDTDIENRFTYHPPKEGQPALYTHLRAEAKALAYEILKTCPDSRERSLALTRIEEAVFWANAAVARKS